MPHIRISAPLLGLLLYMTEVVAGTGSVVGLVVGDAFGKLLGKSAGSFLKPSKGDIETALSKTCAELNKQLPKNIDEVTQLDSLSSGPGLRLTYKHSVTITKSAGVIAAHLEQVVGPRLRSNLCSQENILLKNGVSLIYAYYGNDGGYVGHIGVRPEDCGFR